MAEQLSSEQFFKPKATSTPEFGSREYLRQVSAGVHPPAMFATASEIVNTHDLGDIGMQVVKKGPDGTYDYHPILDKDELLAHKLYADADLSESIRDHGFDWGQEKFDEAPVRLRNDTLTNGHHRVAGMLAYRPDEFLRVHTGL